MKTTHILLLCILGAALLTAVNCTNANGPDNCCFKFYPRRIKPSIVESYYMTDHRCPSMTTFLSRCMFAALAVCLGSLLCSKLKYLPIKHFLGIA
uniref:Chemokine interleukin-8-like domain-containing protein n=1 Tax=Haplochromis burtoni TaxID=8153 RepID=A0A3Q2VLE4_HAPBU